MTRKCLGNNDNDIEKICNLYKKYNYTLNK